MEEAVSPATRYVTQLDMRPPLLPRLTPTIKPLFCLMITVHVGCGDTCEMTYPTGY